MRKLPDQCPNEAWWDAFKLELTENRRYRTEVGKATYIPVEIAPLGTRALLDEALKMVERLGRSLAAEFGMAFEDGQMLDLTEARALLAKAREGEG